jgi:glycosyltransferase involved in cell wall biosynthesis
MTDPASQTVGRPGLPQPTRVRIVQPGLPKYRVAVFKNLAARENVELEVCHGHIPNLPNADPEGLRTRYEPTLTRLLRPGRWLAWHPVHLRPTGADVIFLMWDVQYLSVLPGILMNRLCGRRTVLWGHGYSRRPSRWRDAMRNFLGRRADAVLTYNHGTAKRLVEELGYAADRVHVAQNTQDTESPRRAKATLEQDPVRLEQFKAAEGIGDEPVFLQVGRYSRLRRYDLHIEAFAKARRHLPQARLAFVGSGYDHPDFQQLLDEHGVRDATLLRPACYDEDALAPWFAVATATVFGDAIGLSLIHSFGYGVPVVTHSDRWSQMPEAEAARHEHNGLLFERGDVDAFAESLVRIASDRPLRDRLARNAYEDARDVYTVQAMADGFVAAVRSCL